MTKPRYRIDLSKQMADCDANYARLMKLLPDLRELDQREFVVSHANGSDVTVIITVIERCKFTTIFDVYQQSPMPGWLQAPHFKVRAYHDVRMAEVIAYQRQHKVEARYEYPNDRMFQPDEKAQLNAFLGEWLSHCLQYGQVNNNNLCAITG